jgi:NitT/TauT family transport system substrate-binding protein
MDNQVRERSMIEKQVDCISGFASSTIPQLKSRGIDVRFMLFSSYGMRMYSLGLITQRKILKEDPALVEAFVDGALEAVSWTIKNQEEAIDIFLAEIKELGMTSSGRDYTKIGLGVHTYITLVDEVKKHGFGWADPKVVEIMTDLVMDNIVKTDGKRPSLEEAFTNRFAGKYRLTDAEWNKATKDSASWAKYLA